jgi:hypothetical protein
MQPCPTKGGLQKQFRGADLAKFHGRFPTVWEFFAAKLRNSAKGNANAFSCAHLYKACCATQ